MFEWNNIWLIFLGSFLTFLATLLVEWIKNRSTKSEKANNFKLIIKQEFIALKKTLERLKTVREYKFFYDYKIIEELVKEVSSLEYLKKDAISLSNSSAQEKFIDLVSDLNSWITGVKVLQDNYYDEEKKLKDEPHFPKRKNKKNTKLSSFKDMEQLINVYNIRSLEKSTDLIEIQRRLDEFIKSLEK